MTSLINEPISDQARPDGDLRVAQDWLDALSTGACDAGTFLCTVQKLTGRAPDLGWDLLSLLDQYYRRGKIKPEVFLTLKARLEAQLLGTALDVSVPLPQTEDPLSAVGQSAPIGPSAAGIGARPPPPTAQADMARAPPPIITAIVASAAPGARREIAIGDVLRGRYRIASILGRGGTGTIFEAIDQYRLDLSNASQRLAIKVLHSAVAEQPELLTELRREFQHLQSLSHPNIVRVHEYDRDGDTAFFTMEYLSGLSLSRVLSARHQMALNRSHALTIIREVGAALVHAHGRSVVHGDLNAGNIFITYDGEVRVLDFGASRARHRGPSVSDVEAQGQKPIATPRYASCQLLEGEPADVRDDACALACVSYLLLAGQHPFGEHTAIHARALGLTAARPAGLTRGQWRALRMGLSFDRDRRPAHVEEWLKPFGLRAATDRLPALPALLKVASPKRGRMRATALTAGVLAMLAVGWWIATNLESVTRTTTALSAGLRAALGTAERLLTQPWHSARNAGRIEVDAGAKPPAIPLPMPAPASVPTPAPVPASASSSSSPPHAGAATRLAAASSDAASGTAHAASGTALRSRIEMAANTIDVPPADPTAHVVVHRSGDLHGDASFSWWTESGTAKPGKDFAPTAAHEEQIKDGKSAVSLLVPVVADPTRHQSKSFYVVISDPSPGASLGHRTVTMVTISPAE